ncbi:PRC-barrel domain-containing protein [Pseudomarimonas arenosa]|uniref:PRC-barrel domain-containing protein n=1 Tax=Pseudomarimonas arenosa TaxID=2774145 RepID=A0AAW3ZPI8_9GAMM|nr:PRC-barrel domain-containing protein [Pseudomarimonas arenosa]MBD8527435.1 PRC-barrel domain-containing protein [Pseudomarimonas arenosa]
MNHASKDTHGKRKPDDGAGKGPGPSIRHGPGPELMSAAALVGDSVVNCHHEEVGDIKEIMLDMRSGRVGYALLSFGGFPGMGEKLFTVPWNALTLDTLNKRFILDVEKARLESAPGFSMNNWPNMADATWAREIHAYYGTQPFGP